MKRIRRRLEDETVEMGGFVTTNSSTSCVAYMRGERNEEQILFHHLLVSDPGENGRRAANGFVPRTLERPKSGTLRVQSVDKQQVTTYCSCCGLVLGPYAPIFNIVPLQE